MDKSLHDLVENYAEITPKLHAKNATPPTPKIGRGAKRRGQFCAPPVSRFCAQFWRNFAVIFNQIGQRFVPPQLIVSLPRLDLPTFKFKMFGDTHISRTSVLFAINTSCDYVYVVSTSPLRLVFDKSR